MSETTCPECNYRLKLSAHAHPGQRVICSKCNSSLVVSSVNPLELDFVPLVNQAKPSKKRPNLVEVPCPECDNLIKLPARIQEGEQVVCGTCHTKLEVVDTEPIELEAMPVNLKWSHQRKISRNKPEERRQDRPKRKK